MGENDTETRGHKHIAELNFVVVTAEVAAKTDGGHAEVEDAERGLRPSGSADEVWVIEPAGGI